MGGIHNNKREIVFVWGSLNNRRKRSFIIAVAIEWQWQWRWSEGEDA